jgi:hypothetical protein
MADYTPTSVYNLLKAESCKFSFESSPDEDIHPSREYNMVHTAGVDPMRGAGDKPTHPLVQHE